MAVPNRINDAESRIVGMMLGSAIGDAVGLYTEGLTADEARTYYPDGQFHLDSTGQNLTDYYPDDHRSNFDDGSWTDDTDMALCILLAFLHTGGTDHVAIATRFKDWRNKGLRALDTLAPDIDTHNDIVVNRLDYLRSETGGPLASSHNYWVATGGGEIEGSGNGAVMRTHPVGAICANRSLHEAYTAASAISRLTHPDPRCVVSALIVTALARGLIRGEIRTTQALDRHLQISVRWYSNQRYAEERNYYPLDRASRAELSRIVTVESLADLKLDDPKTAAERRSGGHTYKTLGAAIYCLRVAMTRLAQVGSLGPVSDSTRTSLFEELINDLTMAAGDAGTNAAVAGALLGAYLGYGAIPAHWRNGLRNRRFMMSKSRSLCMTLKVIPGNYAFGSEADTALAGGRPELDDAAIDARKAAFDVWKRLRMDTLQKRWSSN